MPLRPLLVVGTRAEAIKMAPVALACARRGAAVAPWLCLTGQHRDLVGEVLEHFGLAADFDLGCMAEDGNPATLAARLIERLDGLIGDLAPDYVVAVGDTTSVLAAAMAAFYRRRPLVHVEAGLRTDDLDAPWPEEFNRRVATIAATLHCAATGAAAERLRREGVADGHILVTGNTSIDALRWTLRRLGAAAGRDEPTVLLTCHRRESFGAPLAGIVAAVAELARRFPEVLFTWPVHPNPCVGRALGPLAGIANVQLLPPAPYPGFVDLMRRARLILTDSGGVQEEAPTLGTPCLVLRDATERPEAIAAGMNELVGTSPAAILERASALLTAPRQRRAWRANPYGDGRAGERIVDWMLRRAGTRAPRARQVA